MSYADSFKKDIFNVNEENFDLYCLSHFEFQYQHNHLYQQYCNFLEKNPTNLSSISDIPFLPIEFFKNHEVKSGKWKEEKVFMSSGTTKGGRSKHFVKDIEFYLKTTKKCYEDRYGNLAGTQILALLPSYQEQGNSSLIAMVDAFIKGAKKDSGYFLNQKDLASHSKSSNRKLLIGVSFALLDVAEKGPMPMKNTIIMETGGMKGRRREITRVELHEQLTKSFEVDEIHSEYGMTELLSQAYGKKGCFSFPKWAKVLVRDINDPFSYLANGETGGINIIDLANVDTCAFIETKDLGKSYNSHFEILGRFDNSDIRGCNLMI